MRLSTVTNLFNWDSSNNYIPVLESMRKCRRIGFRVLDITLSMAKDVKDHPLNGDDWEKWVYEVANEAQKLGIEFSQAHLPFFKISDPYYLDPEKREHFDKVRYRCIQACGMLGVKWAVDHVFHTVNDQCYAPKIKEDCLRYFAPFIEAAKKENVGIAFENMLLTKKNEFSIRYCTTHWELIDFVDSWKDPMVGICWDFGHANTVYRDQTRPLIEIGKRLKALHVHDNFGISDMHFAPFLGSIDWEPIMKTLSDIGYEGDFNFELGNYGAGKPDAVQEMLAKYAYDVGNYLLSLAQ